jgi:hypothetical protein
VGIKKPFQNGKVDFQNENVVLTGKTVREGRKTFSENK